MNRAVRNVLFSVTVASLPLISACLGERGGAEPPLRPLLYTEAPSGSRLELPGYEEWIDPTVDPTAYPSEFGTTAARESATRVGQPAETPEDLILDVFGALLAKDRARLMLHVFDGDSLGSAARMGESAARDAALELEQGVLETFEVFAAGSVSDERPGGLGRLVQANQVVVGRGRNIDGSLATGDQVAEMHWGSELSFSLRNTSVEFKLRFPNLLRGADGIWRLRAPPQIDSRFAVYRAIGLDLKPELMDVDHAAMPMSVGNFWHYRTRQPSIGDDTGAVFGVVTRDGYRDTITDVDVYDGYRVSTIRRMYDDPAKTNERIGYLVTPLRVFDCTRECVRRASDVAWILAYAERQVPEIVIPLTRGSGWGAGGLSRRDNTLRVQLDPASVSVPAGTFSAAYEITRSTAQGRRSSFFVPGVGFVMRRTQTVTHTNLEELVSYRILP